MNVHYLQHVPFEGLGVIESFLRGQGHGLSCTRLFAGEPLPENDSFDWLIIMGGPMGIYDDEQYPWLAAEKFCIDRAITAGKLVLGICLGAQLIADVLGAQVYFSGHREIGWFPVTRSPEIVRTPLADVFPEQVEVFHWHGDTFDIPAQAQPLAQSRACRNQGFIWQDRVVALQFHLETTPDSAAALVEHCGQELDGSPSVQSAKEILADPEKFVRLNTLMFALLEAMQGHFLET